MHLIGQLLSPAGRDLRFSTVHGGAGEGGKGGRPGGSGCSGGEGGGGDGGGGDGGGGEGGGQLVFYRKYEIYL